MVDTFSIQEAPGPEDGGTLKLKLQRLYAPGLPPCCRLSPPRDPSLFRMLAQLELRLQSLGIVEEKTGAEGIYIRER